MLNYLRILRPINLIFIGLTVLVLPLLTQLTVGMDGSTFFFIVLKALNLTIVAAAGYIINDYFDQKADAINKPDEQWVGSLMTGKRAILLHIVLSSLAMMLSIVISHHFQHHFYWMATLILTLLLLLYTPFFKRTMLLGNVLVAGVVAIIPWWALLNSVTPKHEWLIWSMVFFSFCSNWIREVIKDIQDIEGDAVGQYKSIALVKGVSKAVELVKWSWILLLCCVLLFHLFILDEINKWSLVLMLFPGLIGWFPVWIAKNPKDYKRVSRLMKIWMMGATIGFILLFA